MPLLDRTPHRVTVYPATESVDSATGITVRVPGNPLETGIELRCWVQRPRATNDTTDGYRTGLTHELIARSFPGQARSVVLWNGTLYDVPAEPEQRTATATMRHVVVGLVARNPGA